MRKQFDDHQLLLNGGAARGSLWLAPDHLLVVEHEALLLAFRERYRRFDYDSIQGVFLAATATGKWLNALYGSAIVLAGGSAAALAGGARPLNAGTVALGVAAAICAVLLVVNLLRGATGRFNVQTAVQSYRLRPVSRLRQARRVAEALRARCEDAQGGPLTLGEPGAPPLPAPPQAAAPPTSPGREAARNRLPHPTALPAYLALAGFGLMILGELAVNSFWYSGLLVVAACGTFTLLVVAASRGGGLRPNGGAVVWGTGLGLLCLNLAIGYVIGMVEVVVRSIEHPNQPGLATAPGMLKAVARFPEGAPDWLLVVGGASGVLTVLAGLAGAAAIRNQRLRIERLAQPPGADESNN